MDDVRKKLKEQVNKFKNSWNDSKLQVIQILDEFKKDVADLTYWINDKEEICFNVYGKQTKSARENSNSICNKFIRIGFDGQFIVSGIVFRYSETSGDHGTIKQSTDILWTNRYNDIPELTDYVTFLIARELSLPDYQNKRLEVNPKMKI